jgi:pyridoxamine 5'-phosphate oxidase
MTDPTTAPPSPYADLTPPQDPLTWLQAWIDEAGAAGLRDPNAMTVSTVDPQGMPSSRVVLLKGLDAAGLTFFTNRTSQKGVDLAHHPFACAVFFWHDLNRQVRVRGPVSQTTPAEDDAYFASRPRESRLGAWASSQGQPLPDRATFDARLAAVTLQHQGDPDAPPRPPYWGGYRLCPLEVELWIGHPFRWHDRFLYARPDPSSPWLTQRLYP